MTKQEIISAVSEKTEGTKKEAAIYVNAVLDSITEALADGEKVQFTGFGTFDISHRAEREGRNPQTGETITIAAVDVPKFKAGKALKDAVK
ncbi:MAG: hypothetical protein [Bacteriophage sp.]|nr:MAG: hypothetical protein [Bacteriophage sp.]